MKQSIGIGSKLALVDVNGMENPKRIIGVTIIEYDEGTLCFVDDTRFANGAIMKHTQSEAEQVKEFMKSIGLIA